MDSKFYSPVENEWMRYADPQQYKSDSYDDFTRYNDGIETLQSLYQKQKLSASQLPYTTRLSRQDVGGGPGVYDSLADLIPPTRPLPRHPTMCPLTHNGNMTQEQEQDLLMDSFTGTELTPFNNPTSYEPSFPKMFHDGPHTGGGENVEEKFNANHQMTSQMRPSVIMTSSQQSQQFRMLQGSNFSMTSDNNSSKPSSQSNNNYTEKSLKANTEQQKIATAQKTSTTSSTGKTRTKDKYRTVYSEVQKAELERQYVTNTYITAQRKADISRLVALSERQVKIWFQNRRAKDRKYRNKRNVIHNKELDRSMNQDVPSRFLSHSTGAMFPPGEATMPNLALPHSVLGLRAMQQNSAMMVENNTGLVNRYNVMNNELFT